MAENKPSFFKSMFSSVVSYFKGGLIGGIVGAAAGGLIGLIAGAVTGNYGFALAGAEIGGALLGTVGSISAVATSVVRNQQTSTVPVEDAVKAVQVAYAQGAAVEQQRQKNWGQYVRDREAKAATHDAGQRLHS